MNVAYTDTVTEKTLFIIAQYYMLSSPVQHKV